jgi:hypothetical protein
VSAAYRATLARISSAVLVQTNGLGAALEVFRNCSIASCNWRTLGVSALGGARSQRQGWLRPLQRLILIANLSWRSRTGLIKERTHASLQKAFAQGADGLVARSQPLLDLSAHRACGQHQNHAHPEGWGALADSDVSIAPTRPVSGVNWMDGAFLPRLFMERE